MSDRDFLFWMTEELRRLAEPLEVALRSPANFTAFLGRYGWSPPPGSFQIEDVRSAFDLMDDLQNSTVLFGELLSPPSGDFPLDRYIELVEIFRSLADKLRHIALRPPPTGLSAQLWTTFGSDLLHGLVADYLEFFRPPLFALLIATGIIQEALDAKDGTPDRIAFVRRRIQWSRISQLFLDPSELVREEYGWNTPSGLRHEHLIDRLQRMLGMLRLPLEIRAPTPALRDAYYASGNPALPSVRELGVHLMIGENEEGNVFEYTLAVLPVPPIDAASAPPRGLVLAPSFVLDAQPTAILWPFSLEFGGLVQSEAGIRLEIDPERIGVSSGGAGAQTVDASLALIFQSPNAQQLVGSPFSNRLLLHGWRIGIAISGSIADPELALEFDLTGLQLVATFAEGDSFLAELFDPKPKPMRFDAGFVWSSKTGFHFRGAGTLELTIPLHLSLGSIALTHATLAITPKENETTITAGVSGSGKIGPVTVVVANTGVKLAIVPVPEGAPSGVLGDLDLEFGFKFPDGLGLTIERSAVSGGGFLEYNKARAEYSGNVQLEIAEKIAVKAIGLLITRMPDGSKGYSLTVIITAGGFAPIQLGYGFTLTGIGGLLAINRTFAEEALRAGLKNHTLDSVMFPQDPIRNAPQIISNLNKVFPPANGHHLFGPMAQISWPTPALITADVGVVLELGARLRLLILAQVVAILPKRENDLVRLQMDAIGVLDFDQGTAALDATLYDSRLLRKFVLTGDMAMRLKWEGSPNFALAVGGLHPAFNPPTNFPKLERIAINLSAGDNPRIRCEAYFALTANTVQFGARAELYASASAFSIQGEIGYDVLIQFDPFYFLADFYAQLQLKRGSTNLFKVRVEGALAGPRPLHIKAKATFEILWWDVSIRVDRTLVEGEKPPLPEPVDVLPRLKEALGNSGNWIGQLPAGQRPMVTLRAKPGASTDVLLHPLGTLTVKQGVVPLNMEISRFGQAEPAGARRFTISSVSLGGQNQTPQPVKDFFAPAQFFEMSDDEKLSRPSFESMASGVSIGLSTFVVPDNPTDWLEVGAIEFETWIVDKEKNETRPSHPEDQEGQKNLYTLSKALLLQQARFGAASNSELRRTGKAKYRTAMMGKHRIEKEGWSIVATSDLTVEPVPGIEDGKPRIYSEAVQALQKLKEADPAKAVGLKILRLSEVRELSE